MEFIPLRSCLLRKAKGKGKEERKQLQVGFSWNILSSPIGQTFLSRARIPEFLA
jgi:hypothetical protein